MRLIGWVLALVLWSSPACGADSPIAIRTSTPDLGGPLTATNLSTWSVMPASAQDATGLTVIGGNVSNPLVGLPLHGYQVSETSETSVTTSLLVARSLQGDHTDNVVGVRVESRTPGFTLGLNAVSITGEAQPETVTGLDGTWRNKHWTESVSVADAKNVFDASAALSWQNRGTHANVQWTHGQLCSSVGIGSLTVSATPGTVACSTTFRLGTCAVQPSVTSTGVAGLAVSSHHGWSASLQVGQGQDQLVVSKGTLQLQVLPNGGRIHWSTRF